MSAPILKHCAAPPATGALSVLAGRGAAVYAPVGGAWGRLKAGPTAHPINDRRADNDRRAANVRAVSGGRAAGKAAAAEKIPVSMRNMRVTSSAPKDSNRIKKLELKCFQTPPGYAHYIRQWGDRL